MPVGGPEETARRPSVDPALWLVHVRYHRTRAPADLDALVVEYTGFALAIARRLHRSGESQDDLDQVALESLVLSLQRFDPGRRRPFPAFASPTITGALKRHYRDRGWAVRAPRQVHDLAGPIRTARDDLGGVLGRPARRAEVADAVGVAEDVVRSVDEAVRARSAASLDRPLSDDGVTLGESFGRTDHDLDMTDDRIALAGALDVLDERDRDLIALYYVEELSQREIARRYGVSQMQVSRWLTRIVNRLRARMVPA